MSEFSFCPYTGHLSARLIKRVEKKFPEVSVINYTEPRGEKRGWCSGPNLGHPFDGALAKSVVEFLRTAAKGRDAETLGFDSEAE